MSDYNSYKVNQEGPLGRKIKIIIIQGEDVIVYLDEDETIQWATTDSANTPKGFGDIQNKISFWESFSNRLFSKEEAYDYKCLLAEAYARILDDKDEKTANEIIERTVNKIQIHGKEILKQEYILSSLYCTVIVMLLIILIVIFKCCLLTIINEEVYEIILTALFGGIGAFVFANLRLKNYSPDIVVSKEIHRVDGRLRIFYGVVSGLIIAIAIKSNIVLGFINQVTISIYLKLFMGLMAGASEIIIPNLIKQTEDKANK